MRGWLAITLLATGCRSILGIDGASVAGDDVGFPDAPPGDSDIDAAADANPVDCYGSGLLQVCLPTPPTGPRNLATTIDTTSSASCDLVLTLPSGTACVIAGTTISVTGGSIVRAVGTRPLVLVATSTITIGGTLSASSVRTGGPGAAANNTACAGQVAAEADTGGGGGGGGGSFITVGATGGNGDLNDSGAPAGTGAGGLPGSAAIPTFVRGGCRGGVGGTGNVASGAGGDGGGAIYLIAATSINVSITGIVSANGAGGGAGATQHGGGGGGGSGGLVGLDAPAVTITGVASANGGGGGGGATTQVGQAGSDGAASSFSAVGGSGGGAGGGTGGSGGASTTPATAGASETSGGGGGGGGVGIVYVKGTLTTNGTISPPATVF